ncbi:hypothetical protein E4U49_007798 [Claviceps purpurea]|nr:hypothetical protein E4U49_007798 [Claviceps purpurea]
MPGEKLPFKVFPLPIGLAESPHPLTSRLQQEGPPRRCVTRSQPIFRVIPRDLGGVAAEDVNEVRSGKFELLNLLRLHPTRERSTYEHESTSVMDYSCRKIGSRKKTFTAKDYGTTATICCPSHSLYKLSHRLDSLVAFIRLIAYPRQAGLPGESLRLLCDIAQEAELSWAKTTS